MWKPGCAIAVTIALVAACSAFDAENEGRDPAPDGGGTTDMTLDGAASSGRPGDPIEASSGGSSGAASSGSACPNLCDASTFCERFERAQPTTDEWESLTDLEPSSAAFHIARDGGTSSCDGAFYAYVDYPAIGTSAGRLLARKIAIPNQRIVLDFSFVFYGDPATIDGEERAMFVAVTRTKIFSVDEGPFIAFVVKDKALAMVGRGADNETRATGSEPLESGRPYQVRLDLDLKGGDSTLAIAGSSSSTADFTSLGPAGDYWILVGSAVAKLGSTGGGVGARFDDLEVSLP